MRGRLRQLTILISTPFVAACLISVATGLIMPSPVSADTKPDGARVTESASCGRYSGDQKKACSFGYGTTLGTRAAKHLEPTHDYNSDETADAAAACKKYHVDANNKACVRGYKDGHYAYYHVSSTNPVTRDSGHESAGNKASSCTTDFCDPASECTKANCDLIDKYVNPAINMLTVIFGLVAVISLILGGIQYITSTGDPQNVSKAKQRITNTIIAIVAYLFLYGFLQFLVPGGIFNRSS